jgi:hypothetical protein
MSRIPPTLTGVRDLPAPPDLEWNEENPPTVHSCSGNDGEHTPDCDGNCDELPLDELDVLLNNEMHAWQRAGMNPGMIPHDVLHMSTQIDTMIKMLITSPELSKQYNDIFRTIMLDKFRRFRENNEAGFRKARLAAELGVGQPPHPIIAPNLKRKH